MTTSPLAVTQFVEARLSEDEWDARPFRNDLGDIKSWRADEVGGVVRQVGPTEFGLDDMLARTETHLEAAHIARHDPARVLAQCAAMRKIVEDYTEELDYDRRYPYHCDTGDCTALGLRDAIVALASIWSSHPDFKEEWR